MIPLSSGWKPTDYMLKRIACSHASRRRPYLLSNNAAAAVADFEPIWLLPRQTSREPPPTLDRAGTRVAVKGAYDVQPQTFARLRHWLAVLVIGISSVALLAFSRL
jgi:hypothetical protein